MDTGTQEQARRHKREAVSALLMTNGLAKGHARLTLRHVETWHSMQSFELVPKIWQGKVERIFAECVSTSQLRQIEQAVALYVSGDDTELRPFIRRRVSVEIGTRARNSSYGAAPVWRSRKFSDPLFVTPAGFLNAYPEVDEDLFIDSVQAQQAVTFYRDIPSKFKLENASFQISEPAVLGKIGGPGFKRWLAEVKGQQYTEPRRPLAEAHALYLQGGRAQLEKEYSPSYVFALIRKFNAEGLALQKEDRDRIVHPYGHAFTPRPLGAGKGVS